MNSDTLSQPTFASFYDFYDGPEYRDDQLQMYRDLANEAGDPVLELACGTGIITIDLARAGHNITGLDISEDMLNVATQKLAQEDAEVRSRICLVEANMKNFKLKEQFKCILIPTNSFGYLTDPNDRTSCLQAVHDHLAPGGLLVIEERNYTPEVLMNMRQRRLVTTAQMARTNPATGKYTTYNWTTTHIDFVNQTTYSRSFIDETQEDGTVKRYIRGDGTARNHYFNRFELQLLLEQAGFTVIHLWGAPDRRELGPRDYNMIFVATKR